MKMDRCIIIASWTHYGANSLQNYVFLELKFYSQSKRFFFKKKEEIISSNFMFDLDTVSSLNCLKCELE